MNPFELARAELHPPWDAARTLAAVDVLLRDGLLVGGTHYRLFGWRRGRAFSLSLGMPLLGGGAPVLRARVRDDPTPTTLDVAVGARHEIVLFTGFWGLLTVLGGGYQLWLQCARVFSGEAGWGAVGEVLPGIALMAALVVGGLWFWRARQRPQALALLEQVRLHLQAAHAATPARPLASEPIS